MKNIFIIFFFTINLSLCAQNVKIAAAADLRYALDDVIKEYARVRPKVRINAVYGSSGNAYNQIINGAPYDVYFSADIMYPKKLSEGGHTLTSPKLYAIGRIVLWSSSLDVSKGISVLKEHAGIRIAIANPAHAPYGGRSVETLKYYNIYESLKKQLIYGENVSQAAQFCLSGNAEAGFIALSLVLSPNMVNKGKYFLIDEKSHKPLEQAYVVLRHAEGNKDAFDFASYMNTKAARSIFEKYGFALPATAD